MKIHDALVYELIRPDKWGKPTGGSFIEMIGTGKFRYLLEHTFLDRLNKPMTPDIYVFDISGRTERVIVELETDVDFDFGESLRQIKKYKSIERHHPVVVKAIIPYEYRSFASLYGNEDIGVWLWKATRVLQCLRCKSTTEMEGPFQPKCGACNKYIPHRLVGLKDTEFTEYIPS